LPAGQEPSAVVRAGNDPIAAELAAEYFNLGFEESDAGVATSRIRFGQEMRKKIEPTKHGK